MPGTSHTLFVAQTIALHMALSSNSSAAEPAQRPFRGPARGGFNRPAGLLFAAPGTLHTTTGSWTPHDPIGYEAGDADLFRYVGNDPVNEDDYSGLDELTITKQGQAVDLKDNKFKLADGTEGTVIAFTDVETKEPDKEPNTNRIQLRFTSKNEVMAKAHWLQLAKREIKGDKEALPGYYQTIYVLQDDMKRPLYHGYGDLHIDGTSTNPFCDAILTDNDLSFFDRPSLRVGDGITEEEFDADAYLIYEGKAYYHVHWARALQGNGPAKCMNVSGEQVTAKNLPDVLKAETIEAGSFQIRKEGNGIVFINILEIPNPITPDNRR